MKPVLAPSILSLDIVVTCDGYTIRGKRNASSIDLVKLVKVTEIHIIYGR